MKIGKTEKYIIGKLRKRPLHFSLIDPDPDKVSLKRISEFARSLEEFKTDAILIGGSTGVTQKVLDRSIREIKKYFRCPVILYPGNANGISKKADAILFLSLVNSKDPLWITGIQAIEAPTVKNLGIEPIPMAYIIVEPGMRAGEVGRANAIKQNEFKTAADYALSAQYMGMRFVYLEAGSGAHRPVPPEMIRHVRKTISANLIVGGGIRTPEAALSALKAGADIIVTGTVIEDSPERVGEIINAVRSFRR